MLHAADTDIGRTRHNDYKMEIIAMDNQQNKSFNKYDQTSENNKLYIHRQQSLHLR